MEDLSKYNHQWELIHLESGLKIRWCRACGAWQREFTQSFTLTAIVGGIQYPTNVRGACRDN